MLRCCFAGDPAALTWAGRAIRELLLGSRGLEFPTSLQASTAYGHRPEFALPPMIRSVAKRPPTGRVRLLCGPAFALPEAIDRGIYWALSAFDPFNLSPMEKSNLDNADFIWLPTDLHKKQAMAAGLRSSKIGIVHPGVNHKVFHPKAAPSDFLSEESGFMFVTIASPLNRKGLDILIRAYVEEFKPRDNVLLVIKMSHQSKPKKDFPYEIPGLAKRLGGLNAQLARVLILEEAIEDEMVAALLARADAYVCANRTFQTALAVREALACGRPVIGPEGLRDLVGLGENTGYLVKTNPAQVPEDFLFPGSPAATIAEPDVESLRKSLREAFSDIRTARRKGNEAQRFSRSFPDWRPGSRTLSEKLASLPTTASFSGSKAGSTER